MPGVYEIETSLAEEQVVAYLKDELPAVLAGDAPDTHGVGRAVLARVAHRAMELVQEDYERKSLGGQGADGTQWLPLSEVTLRERASRRAGESGRPGPDDMPKTPEDWSAFRRRREEVYKEEYARLRRGGIPAKEARRQAAIVARFMAQSWWASHGVEHGRGEPGHGGDEGYGNTLILRDTGRLLASASAGTLSGTGLAARYTPASPEQTAYLGDGVAQVESLVPYGDKHMRPHQGSMTGQPVPARPWKYAGGEGKFPEEWTEELARVYAEALAECLPEVLARLGG